MPIEAPNSSPRSPSLKSFPRRVAGWKRFGQRMPTTRHIEAMGIRAVDILLRFPMHIVLFLYFQLIGDAIPSHHCQLDPEDGHDDSEEVPTPDVVHVKPKGEETDGGDAADDPGETRGFETMVQETFIDHGTDDREFHFSLSSVKI